MESFSLAFISGVFNVYKNFYLRLLNNEKDSIKDFISKNTIEFELFEEVFNSLDKYKAHEKEGYVLNIDEFMVKVKCDDYVNIHRILSNVSSINLIIEKIANDEFDDMISKIPTAYRDRVMKVANLIFNYIKSIDKEIKKLYNKADKTDNVLVNAPHPEYEVVADNWSHAYSREKAAYPIQSVRDNKFWLNVARVDNTLGDRKLLTTRYETFD
jgi:hypothetical protein